MPNQSTSGNFNVQSVATLIASSLDMSQDADKSQTLTRIVHKLTKEHTFPMNAARDAAAIAIAETESVNHGTIFDLNASTEKCVFVNVDGVRRAITLADIVSHFEFQ